jgi:hypothetical protein
MLIILLIFGLMQMASCQNDEKLIFMAQLVRHGARGPIINLLPINWQEDRDLELMELLDSGWRQHYLSGLNMRLKYPDFFENLSIDEYSVSPTGRERTHESANARMNGIMDTMDFLKNGGIVEGFDEQNPVNLKNFILKNPAIDMDPVNRFAAFKGC